LTLICLEAGAIGLIGAALGTVMGLALAAAGSQMLDRILGQGINWARLSGAELIYFAGAVVLAVLAGLVPAMKAYSTPVATHLVGE
jgi:ABC-type antimicrobial peptide transport system permease subunit